MDQKNLKPLLVNNNCLFLDSYAQMTQKTQKQCNMKKYYVVKNLTLSKFVMNKINRYFKSNWKGTCILLYGNVNMNKNYTLVGTQDTVQPLPAAEYFLQ